jgi:hypothetical protein
MSGGLGNDLFVASNQSGSQFENGIVPVELNANDITTVADFLSGSDHLAMSNSAHGLTKIAGNGDNASQAEAAANAFYAAQAGTSEYVYVYGGTGAGYLFYNGDGGGHTFATGGMALTGVNGEQSIGVNDLAVSQFA